MAYSKKNVLPLNNFETSINCLKVYSCIKLKKKKKLRLSILLLYGQNVKNHNLCNDT